MLKEALLEMRDMQKHGAKPLLRRTKKLIRQKAPHLLAGAAAAGALIGGAHLYHRAREALDYRNDFSDMMDTHPSLWDEDQDTVTTRFNTLHNLAPTLASDPLVAGSIVKQWIEYPVLTAATLKDVAKAENDLREEPSLMERLFDVSAVLT